MDPIKCFWVAERGDGVFIRTDTGEKVTLRDVPAGGMWDAHWMDAGGIPLDGKVIHLVVRIPGGHDWMPGTESSNCTRKGEDHDCWCVHGSPPRLTVDKNPEPGRSTCQAGGGSIQSGKFHGFLTDGYLVSV